MKRINSITIMKPGSRIYPVVIAIFMIMAINCFIHHQDKSKFVIHAQDKTQDKNEFVSLSPNKDNTIIVRVDSGDGNVFLKTKDLHEYKMFSAYFRYEPKITWLTDDLV